MAKKMCNSFIGNFNSKYEKRSYGFISKDFNTCCSYFYRSN